MPAPDARAGDRRTRRAAPSRWSCGPAWGLLRGRVLPWTARPPVRCRCRAPASSAASRPREPQRRAARPLAQDGAASPIAALKVRGTERTPSARVLEILAAEGLRQGETLPWPEDARVTAGARSPRCRPTPSSASPCDLRAARRRAEQRHPHRRRRGAQLARGHRPVPQDISLHPLPRRHPGARAQLPRPRPRHATAASCGAACRGQVPRSRRQRAFRLHLAARACAAASSASPAPSTSPLRASRTGSPLPGHDPDPSLFRSRRLRPDRRHPRHHLQRKQLHLDLRPQPTSSSIIGTDSPSIRPTLRRSANRGRSTSSCSSGVHRLTSFNTSGLNYDGRDEAARIGKGARVTLGRQLSSPLVGSEYEYIKLVAGGVPTASRLPLGPLDHLQRRRRADRRAGPRGSERFFAGDLSD